MNYLEIAPSAGVSRFIKCYWVLEDESPLSSVQTIVPDGRAELILNLDQPFQSQPNGKWQPQPACFFVGQITSPLSVRQNGKTTVLGVRFHPHGAGQLLGLPMDQLTDSVVSVDDFSPRLQGRLDRLRDLNPLAKQLEALDKLMLVQAQLIGREDGAISHAVEASERARGLIRVGALAHQVGLSPRQFERRFKELVGIGPKLFCRMLRFQSVFQATDVPGINWVDAAINCGYYDQAHLIRDFREFAGNTPTALLAEEFDLTRNFAAR